MKMSRTAKRMAKNNSKVGDVPKLNLVSLMDIFTILVFFLLFNSGDSEILQSNKDIELPKSISEQQPVNSLVISLTDDLVMVEGLEVAKTTDLVEGNFEGLTNELTYRASKREVLTEEEDILGRPVTIMADETLQYALLKQVMAVCAQNGYRNISLAVSKVARGS